MAVGSIVVLKQRLKIYFTRLESGGGGDGGVITERLPWLLIMTGSDVDLRLPLTSPDDPGCILFQRNRLKYN